MWIWGRHEAVTHGYTHTARSSEGVCVRVCAHTCAHTPVCRSPLSLAFFFAALMQKAWLCHFPVEVQLPHPSNTLLLLPLWGPQETHTIPLSGAAPSWPPPCPWLPAEVNERERTAAGKGRNQVTGTGRWHFCFKGKKWSLSFHFSVKRCPQFLVFYSRFLQFWKWLRNPLSLLVQTTDKWCGRIQSNGVLCWPSPDLQREAVPLQIVFILLNQRLRTLSSACKLAGGTSFALCKVFILTVNMLESVVSHFSAKYKGSHPVVNQVTGEHVQST